MSLRWLQLQCWWEWANHWHKQNNVVCGRHNQNAMHERVFATRSAAQFFVSFLSRLKSQTQRERERERERESGKVNEWERRCKGKKKKGYKRKRTKIKDKREKGDSGARFERHRCVRSAVWPDEGIKISQFFPQKLPKRVETSDYIQIATSLKWPKKFQDIWAIIAGKFVTNTFQNSPIWSHWRSVMPDGRSGKRYFSATE